MQSPAQTDKHCLINILNFACQSCLYVWPPPQTLLDKHILLLRVSKTFACDYSSQAKDVCQAHASVLAKLTNIVLDNQNLTCLQNNLFLLGQGLRLSTGLGSSLKTRSDAFRSDGN